VSPVEGSRATPSGEIIRWRTVGVDQAAEDASLPFFIERDPNTRFPGEAPAPGATLTGLEIEGSTARLSAWLGDHSLPVRVTEGAAGITKVVLASEGSEIVIERDRIGR
jgi:hypothetical protein